MSRCSWWPPVQLPGFDITMAWHHRFNLDPGNTWLRGVFVSLFDGLKVVPPGALAAASSRRRT